MPEQIANKIKTELKKYSQSEKIKILQSFFRTGKGEYAEGDQMIAVSVPNQRKIAKQHLDVDLEVIAELLQSKIHEHRLTGLIILVYQYQKTPDLKQKKKIYDFYLANRSRVNNWDLVDLSAHYIVGDFLNKEKNRKILFYLAHSKVLWDRRIAMIACFAFIRNKDFGDALAIAKILLTDKQDLIHKAVGWMLREIGKRDQSLELQFIKDNLKQMHRTTLRYALEKYSKDLRDEFMFLHKKNRPA